MKTNVLKRIKNLKKKKLSTVDKISRFLEREANKPLPYTPKAGHRPSSISSTKCFRKMYYSYFRVKPDRLLGSHLLRIFATGNFLEDMIQDWLVSVGEYIPYRNKSNGEIPKDRWRDKLDPQFPISSSRWRIKKGKIDGVGFSGDELWLYEIKTIKQENFQKLASPQPEHLEQVAMYFQCFNDLLLAKEYAHIPELEGAGKAVGAKIIYINKNTSELLEFAIGGEVLTQTILDLDKKVLKANEFIDKKELPPLTKDKCIWCDFYKKCGDDWNGIEILPESDKLQK